MSQTIWSKLHSGYKEENWINIPSLFAETVIDYFPKSKKILELGAGQGQDARFFAERGHRVYSTDISESALEWGKAKIPQRLKNKITILQLDLCGEFPFSDGSFDVAYAHLSLHYFDQATTTKIFGEIRRVLKKGGLFAFLVNSIHDPEYGCGQEIGDDFFNINGVSKRYFSVSTARMFVAGFDILLLDDLGETYKDRAKGVHHLIRFVGTKTAQ
jgi:SAM-dependent methyltransferase